MCFAVCAVTLCRFGWPRPFLSVLGRCLQRIKKSLRRIKKSLRGVTFFRYPNVHQFGMKVHQFGNKISIVRQQGRGPGFLKQWQDCPPLSSGAGRPLFEDFIVFIIFHFFSSPQTVGAQSFAGRGGNKNSIVGNRISIVGNKNSIVGNHFSIVPQSWMETPLSSILYPAIQLHSLKWSRYFWILSGARLRFIFVSIPQRA